MTDVNKAEGGVDEVLGNLLGEYHDHKCPSNCDTGCMNCRNTGYNQTPCSVCDKDGVAFKNRKETLAKLQSDLLAIVGDDEPGMAGNTHKNGAINRNQLRAELRERIKEYFNGR